MGYFKSFSACGETWEYIGEMSFQTNKADFFLNAAQCKSSFPF